MKNVRALYPGTFDPVHNGHLDIIKRAAMMFEEIVVGVYDHGRPIKKVLFSADQRIDMLTTALNGQSNVTVQRYNNLTAAFAREIGASVIVRGLRVFSDFEFEFRMATANRRLEPNIDQVTLMSREEHMFLSSTIVREIASHHGDVSGMVPSVVQAALRQQFSGE